MKTHNYNRRCTYVKNSNNPCEDCPRVISTLYRCEFLKEGFKSKIEDDERYL